MKTITKKERELLKKFNWTIQIIQNDLMNKKELKKTTNLDQLAIEKLQLSWAEKQFCLDFSSSNYLPLWLPEFVYSEPYKYLEIEDFEKKLLNNWFDKLKRIKSKIEHKWYIFNVISYRLNKSIYWTYLESIPHTIIANTWETEILINVE